jgi:hypothetical protein
MLGVERHAGSMARKAVRAAVMQPQTTREPTLKATMLAGEKGAHPAGSPSHLLR